jgi:EpsI family protein
MVYSRLLGGVTEMRWLRLAVSSGLLIGTFGFLHSYSHGEAVPIRRSLEGFPMKIGPWQGRESTLLDNQILELLRPTDYLIRRYQNPVGQDLLLYIGYWETQLEGAQFHSPKNCLPGGGWQPLEATIVPVPVNDRAEPVPVNRYVLQKGTDRLLVAYWYQAQGEPLASEFSAKIALVRNSIFLNRSDGAIVRVSSPVRGSVSATWASLVDYLSLLYPRLHGFLPD